jgi:hypothetical protein
VAEEEIYILVWTLPTYMVEELYFFVSIKLISAQNSRWKF